MHIPDSYITPMKTLVLSGSLKPESKSRILAQLSHALLLAQGAEAVYADLRDFPLPLCDGDAAYSSPEVGRLRDLVQEASGIIVATPIYNYYGSAAVKNAIELTGGAWEDKTVAFLCAAGGQSSYMSVMALANNLMLDFRCVIVPRFVYATGAAFANGESPT